MGDFLSTKSNSQATTNQQVGVSGNGTGQSGTVGGNQAGGNSTALGNLTAHSNSTINIVTSDIAALQANQAIATGAINAGLQTSIYALDTVQRNSHETNDLISQVVAGSNDVALKATPVSAGEIVKPILMLVAIAAGIVLLFQVIPKKP